MLEIVKPTLEHRHALARFFAALCDAGDERFFRPHPLDGEAADQICRYSGDDLYYIAVANGAADVLAYGILRGWDEGFDVPSLGIAVHPRARGSRIARTMMDFLHAAAQAKGATRVRLRVHEENRAAISLYRNLGYDFPSKAGALLVGYHDLGHGRRFIPWARPMLFGDEKRFASAAIDTTAISGGPYLDQFENDLAGVHGLDSVLAVSNGTAALQLALLTLGIERGDEVIVPGWGFMAAANMVLACGAKPVFADVDPATWLIDPASVAAKMTHDTRAIVAIHTYGNVCDMGWLRDVAQQGLGVSLIEDCAESLFSYYRGRHCGYSGDIATWSFQATKTITCGEGGAVAFRDLELAARAKLIRSHGMGGDKKYWHHLVGHNFRLTNIQAAVLCAQLGHRAEIEEMRARVYGAYAARLQAVPGIKLQQIPTEVSPVMWALGVLLPAGFPRDKLMADLLAEGIETRPGFYSAAQQPLYECPALPVADDIAARMICLPMPADLDEADLHHVCDRFIARLG